MQVVKRDGKFVDFDKDKIRIAIGKANDVGSDSPLQYRALYDIIFQKYVRNT